MASKGLARRSVLLMTYAVWIDRRRPSSVRRRRVAENIGHERSRVIIKRQKRTALAGPGRPNVKPAAGGPPQIRLPDMRYVTTRASIRGEPPRPKFAPTPRLSIEGVIDECRSRAGVGSPADLDCGSSKRVIA